MSADVRIGVDLGGTKIEAIALDAAGVEIFRRRIATPRGDYDAHARCDRGSWSTRPMRPPARAARVGIGMPGAISPATGLVKNANSTWLIGRPLRDDLARRARAARAARERRQLLRAVGGHRRRRRGRTTSCSA